ncbi:MAG TPA: beta-aspartyl-peptidase, partial [Synergistaceae bacterium]|nr:beta-aspartyl-peptidase [Synergistaceae bacterium]
MRLELHKVSVRNVSWGDETKVEKGTLFVNREEMLSVAMKDNRFARAGLEFARPGESVRIIPVKDVIEPRCKL